MSVITYYEVHLGFCANCRDEILKSLEASTIVDQVVFPVKRERTLSCDILSNHHGPIVQRIKVLAKKFLGKTHPVRLKLTNDGRRELILAIKNSRF